MVLPRLATTRDSGIHNFPQAFRRGRPADRLHRPLGLKIDKDYEVGFLISYILNCRLLTFDWYLGTYPQLY